VLGDVFAAKAELGFGGEQDRLVNSQARGNTNDGATRLSKALRDRTIAVLANESSDGRSSRCRRQDAPRREQ
jgi:hypothetical protein